MASKSLTFELFGSDKTASRAINGVASAGDNMGKIVSRGAFVAGAALAATAVAAVAFSVESIKAFAEAEQAQNRLAFALEKYPALIGTNIESLRSLNSALQLKTRYEDDQIATAQSALALYDLTGDQLKELTPLMLDYAAATGKDLTTSTEDLGKAIMGQGRALKNIGIDFKDAGSPLANYTALVAGLRSQVEGLAEKDAETVAGRLDQINNYFGDIQEKLGEAFLPGLNLAADIVESTLLPQLDQVISRVGPQLAAELDEMAPRIEAAVNKSIPALERLLQAAPDVLGAIADSFSGDLDTIEDGQRVFEEIDGFFNEYLPKWAAGKVSVQESWDGFFNWWDLAWDGSADTVQNKSNEIKDYWSGTVFNMRQAVIDAEMATAGWEFAQGFADGITTNSEAAVLAAERMALRARDKVVNAMQIQSPSKVMRDLGAYIPQGLALGIEDDMWRVGAAFENMGGTPKFSTNKASTMQTGGTNVTVNVNGVVAGNSAQVAQFLYKQLQDGAKTGAIPRVIGA